MKALLIKALVVACEGLVLCAFSSTGDAAQADSGRAVAPASYVLGPNDEVSIQVLELPEFQAKAYRVDMDGAVNVPVAGRVRAAGLTLSQFQTELEQQLRSQVLNPHVTAGLVESKSQPVSVLGEVSNPGTQQIDGSKTLFDVIAGAGGLKQDAGDLIMITRQRDQGSIDLPGALVDPATGRSSAEVSVRDLIELRRPGVNIPVRPRDEVFVSAGRVMYVIGDVRKPGGFTLSGKRPVSALDALSLAEGLGPDASPKGARILRRTSESTLTRKQIPIDLKRVLQGKAEDLQVFPDDILFIPDSKSRKIAARAAETALATVSGVIIWRGL